MFMQNEPTQVHAGPTCQYNHGCPQFYPIHEQRKNKIVIMQKY